LTLRCPSLENVR